jgi:Protein of unknown function (DUF3604)
MCDLAAPSKQMAGWRIATRAPTVARLHDRYSGPVGRSRCGGVLFGLTSVRSHDAEASQARLGTNPYKFGMVGSSDAHTGLAAMKKGNFFGK